MPEVAAELKSRYECIQECSRVNEIAKHVSGLMQFTIAPLLLAPHKQLAAGAQSS
jgi:hypothetical protein